MLVPKLIEKGYHVRVLDLYLYGDGIFGDWHGHENLEEIRGDIRDQQLVTKSVRGSDAVIHLACISNDPSFDLDPSLGKAINYDAFAPLVRAAKENGVRRFIYASSSSVYGVSDAPSVTEDHPLNPLTDYSRFKAMCEPVLLDEGTRDFVPVVVRPATLCGYSPRQRLDLVVNILTHHACMRRRIKVMGGEQKRPNVHVTDMADLYLKFLELPDESIAGKIYNFGFENHTVAQIAEIVRNSVAALTPGSPIAIETVPTDDPRSYHISSDKIRNDLGIVAARTLDDAVRELAAALMQKRIPNPDDPIHYNIQTMKRLSLV